MSRFLREPPSVRMAARVIVTATAVVVVAGGILMRVLDHAEYPNIWIGMWWAPPSERERTGTNASCSHGSHDGLM